MRWILLSLTALLALPMPVHAAQTSVPPFVAVDENLWVAFYDVPSRRFRAIRDAFVRRDFPSAKNDLLTSASFLAIEADRAIPDIAERMTEVSAQMRSIAGNIDDRSVTTASLDQLFGRAHWLLAQHYLYFARVARDAQNNSSTGRYLWAASHHLERAVLWSNKRASRDVVKALEGLRDMAIRLQDDELAAKARRERPIVKAEKVLRDLGRSIERPVVLPPQQKTN